MAASAPTQEPSPKQDFRIQNPAQASQTDRRVFERRNGPQERRNLDRAGEEHEPRRDEINLDRRTTLP